MGTQDYQTFKRTTQNTIRLKTSGVALVHPRLRRFLVINKAWANFRHNIKEANDGLDLIVLDFCDFRWSLTPEGSEYWLNLKEAYKEYKKNTDNRQE